jgi:enolase
MTLIVTRLRAWEILDSRGRPTVSVALTSNGEEFSAAVPSGASTGRREAVELRDHDPARYGGSGVLAAVGHVTGEIASAIVGRRFTDQAALDAALCDLDGTRDKSRLGANAIVGVSMAAARAFAAVGSQPLWKSLTAGGQARVPVPHFNVINGGAHAANPLSFQEFMIAPLGAPSYAEALRAGAEVYAALRRRFADWGQPTGLGDEGGFAPNLTEPYDALQALVEAIEAAGYKAGRDGVAIALDPAATGFWDDGAYQLLGGRLSSDDLVEMYVELVDRFPIWSLEDGIAEDHTDGWRTLTDRLGERIQLVGDDNFVTNPQLIQAAIDAGIANAALIKVNQVGTVTETLAALAVCRRAGYAAMISHRSGETPDTFIADLAVGSGCGQIKSGAPARGERVAKYNRLLEVAAGRDDHSTPALPYGLGGTS